MFKFGVFDIDEKTVFMETEYSFAFTNLKCFRPGHVLVASKRVVDRVGDLTAIEQADLVLLVKRTETLMRDFYNAKDGFCVAVQDGKSAGQTVPHVHYHVIPKIPKSPSEVSKPFYALVHTKYSVPMLDSK